MVQFSQLRIVTGGIDDEDDIAGRIMWLPRKTTELGFPSRLHDHPVVVLSPNARADGKVDFFIITSLSKTDLIDKFPNSIRKRAHYLPIVPAPEHPDNGVLLMLSRQGDYLNLPSYINTEHMYSTYLKELGPYWISPQRPLSLDRSSYARLVAKTATTSTTMTAMTIPEITPQQAPRPTTRTATTMPVMASRPAPRPATMTPITPTIRPVTTTPAARSGTMATTILPATVSRPAPPRPAPRQNIPRATNYSIVTDIPVTPRTDYSALLPTHRDVYHQSTSWPPSEPASSGETFFVSFLVCVAVISLLVLLWYATW